MNAPPFPLNPQVGEAWGQWAWNGAQWVFVGQTGFRQVVQTFGASGPYMPSVGLVSLTVECIGAGGGGGWVGPVSDATKVNGGGGGGSGAYARKTLPAALVRGGVMVTVGKGGSGTYVGAPTGANGGDTSFGALCVAGGGSGGQGNDNTPPSYGLGGLGGWSGAGDFWNYGAAGMNGTDDWLSDAALQVMGEGGIGGASFGGNVPVLIGTGASTNGPDAGANSGAGWTGACVNALVTTEYMSGGTGGDGWVTVTETCLGDTNQPQPPQWRPPLDVNVSFPKPPWPGGAPWPPGAWWPPGGWWGPGPWPPGVPGVPGPRPREAVEFEAGQPYDQSINPETGLPWEDEP